MSDAELFLQSFAAWTDCDSWTTEASGTYVCADAERVGTGRVSACRVVGSGPPRTILRADPALGSALGSITSDTDPLADDAFLAWSQANGAELLGRAIMKTLATPAAPPQRPVLRLDWSNPEHMKLIEGFVERVDEDDLDEAEIELDNLDDHAVCVLDESGQMEAYCSTRPFDEAVTFGDIGIAVVQQSRRKGVGSDVLRGLIHDVLVPEGAHPLYRCDPDNVGSNLVSEAVGFQTVLELVVAEVPS